MNCQLSILIPTYCRKEDLLQTLKCINVQTFKNFEVIIIDSSPPETRLSEENIKSFDFIIEYNLFGIVGNVSMQRNKALEKANGNIILFLDDDVSFENNLFENYMNLFLDSSILAISGLVETTKYRKSDDPIIYKGLKIGDVGSLNHQPCDYVTYTNVICTANFAFRKNLYELFGGFDEKLFGSLDDVDFGFKLIANGVKIVHHPVVQVFHNQTAMSGARSGNLPLRK